MEIVGRVGCAYRQLVLFWRCLPGASQSGLAERYFQYALAARDNALNLLHPEDRPPD